MTALRPWSAVLFSLRGLLLVFAASLCVASFAASPLNRAQALAGLNQPEPRDRLTALAGLAQLGEASDAARVMALLRDADAAVRAAAEAAVWLIWSRSGNAQVDRLHEQGVAQMQNGALEDALATFSQVIGLRPAFAEGWNKRATVHFLMGKHALSLKDCDEVFKRNPQHFGALSGAGQIHLQLGDLRRARDFFRRALEANPNLDGAAQLLPLIEERIRRDDKQRT